MATPIFVTVLQDNTFNYAIPLPKFPKLRVVIGEDIVSELKPLKTAVPQLAPPGAIGGGSAAMLQNNNNASADNLWIAETIAQVVTAMAVASNTTNPFATEKASVTAFSTGGQSSAVLLTKYISTVTAAANADSVKLPAAASSANLVFCVLNTGSPTHSAAVWPTSGDAIYDATQNANSTINTLVSVPGGGFTYFWCDGVKWYTITQVI